MDVCVCVADEHNSVFDGLRLFVASNDNVITSDFRYVTLQLH